MKMKKTRARLIALLLILLFMLSLSVTAFAIISQDGGPTEDDSGPPSGGDGTTPAGGGGNPSGGGGSGGGNPSGGNVAAPSGGASSGPSPQAVISYPTKTVRYDLTDFGSKDFVLLKDTVARNLIKHHGLETLEISYPKKQLFSIPLSELLELIGKESSVTFHQNDGNLELLVAGKTVTPNRESDAENLS